MSGALRITVILALCMAMTHSSLAIPVDVSGHVYEGEVGDVIGRLAGITLSLYASTSPGALGVQVAGTSTDSQGSYHLYLDDSKTYEYFTIVQMNRVGFYSVAATTIGGTVVSPDWIRYGLGQLMTAVTTDNDFYDRRENYPPLANDDEATTAMNVPVNIAVLTNDSDPDGDPITITDVTDPPHGTATHNEQSVTYTPDAGYIGQDSFSYTISDGHSGNDSATVIVKVEAVNHPPIAGNDPAFVTAGGSVTINVLSNDTDEDGDSLAVIGVADPPHGTATHNGQTVTYTPDAEFTGTDTFSYTISDGQEGTDSATITVQIATGNHPPIAGNDSASVTQGGSVTIDVRANDSDPDGDTLMITVASDPPGGSTTHNGQTVTYTPDAWFTGTDAFSYVVSDGRGGTDSATVTVTVLSSASQNGQISGIVVHDLNGDGKLGFRESGLAGWMIFLDDNGDRVASRFEKKALSDASGRFVFTGLNPGTYRVDQVVQSGWKQVWPQDGLGQPAAWAVSLTPGQSVDVVFGEQRMTTPPDANDDSAVQGFSLGQWAFDDPQKFNDQVRDNDFEDRANHHYDRTHVQLVKRLPPDPAGMMQMRNLRDLDPASATYGEMICARATVPFGGYGGARLLVRFAYLFEQSAPELELIVRLSDVPGLLDRTNRASARHYVPIGRVPVPPEGRPGSIGSRRFGVFEGWVSTFPLDLSKGVYVELELVETGGRTGMASLSHGGIRVASSESEGGSALIDDLAVEVHCDGICLDLNWSDTADEEDFLLVIASCGHSVSLGDSPMGSRYCLDGAFSSDGYVDSFDVHSWDWALDDTSRVACNYCRVPLPLADAGSETGGRLLSMSASTDDLKPAGISGLPGDLLVVGKGRVKKAFSDLLEDCYSLFDSNAAYRGNYTITGLPDRCDIRVVRGSANDVYVVNTESGVLRIDGRVETVIPPGRTSVTSDPRFGVPATVYVGIQGHGPDSFGRPVLDAVFDGAGNACVVPVVVQPAGSEPYVAAARLQLRQGSSLPYRVAQLYDDPPLSADNQRRDYLREIEIDGAGNVYVVNVHALNESCILWKYDPDGTMKRRVDLMGPRSPVKIPDPIALHVSHDGRMLYLASGQRDLQTPDSTVLYGLSTQDFSLARSVTIRNMEQVTSVTEDPVTGCLWVAGVSMVDVPAYPSPMDEPFYVPFLAKIPPQVNVVDATCIADPDHYDLALPASIVWVGAGQ